MTTYGDTPGVQVSVEGGGISGVTIGAEEKLLLIGRGDTDQEDLIPGNVYQVTSRRVVKSLFGEDSELTNGVLDAFRNGANPAYTYAAHLPEYDPSDEDTPDDDPLGWLLTAERGDTAYDDDNEEAGEIESGAKHLIDEGESGVYAAFIDGEAEIETLEEVTMDHRNDYKMAKSIAIVPSDIEDENFDTASKSDFMYEVYPTALRERDQDILGGVAGAFAGNSITNPVYNQEVRVDDELNKRLSRTETNEVRDIGAIPLRQNGSIRIADNQSTAEDEDWKRDFWRRRIVDRVILVAQQIGEAMIGRINDEQTRDAARRQIISQIRSMIDQRLLEDGDDSYYVEVVEDGTDSVEINIGVTPTGVVKTVNATIEIDT